MSQLIFWIVTADSALSRKWESLLARQGWQMEIENDFAGFAAAAVKSRYGIALVDWDLSRGATASSVKRLKSRAPGVSVVLVSGTGLAPEKVIEVLEAGADDHFHKNIDDKLFLAKLKAHLRRLLPSLAAALNILKSPGGEVKIDRSSHEAWIRGTRGRLVLVSGLTRTEFQLLTLFLEQPGKVLERRFIMETVWQGAGGDIRPGTVDKHIESLRRKLGRFGDMLRTIYGVGYAFRES